MIDGPGPPVTSLITASPVLARTARIFSGVIGTSGSLETQRILLLTFGDGGAHKGSFGAHKMAMMSPRALSTCGIGVSGGVNPPRAHVGNGPTGGDGEQLPPAVVDMAARGGG
jgi:hypothetical protein